MAIWFWGMGLKLLDNEKQLLRPLHDAFAAFVHGEDPQWGTNGIRDMKRLRSDEQTDVWMDDRWEDGLKVWDLVNGSSSNITGSVQAKL